jgi:hypothetical protein
MLFYLCFSTREGDVLGAFNIICRSVFIRRSIGRETGVLRLAAVAVAFALALMSGSAQAQQQQQQFLVFKSLLSAGSANWCMDDAAGTYQPGVQIAVSGCSGAPSQTFGYENGANLTLGGLCLDGQPSAAGSPVVIAECDGSDHQVWVLQPFQSNNNVFLIGTSEGLCVSVNGAIGQRMPLLLAACEESPAQGWVFYTRPTPARPVYGTYSEPQYYWRGGERYCWYDDAWNGAGWYICGRHTVRGEGYGGPLGWSYWYFPGQTFPPTIRPTMRPTLRPTIVLTVRPTIGPTIRPTIGPTIRPTIVLTIRPTIGPTIRPTLVPTLRPTLAPTIAPTVAPTLKPTLTPTLKPTLSPTIKVTLAPTIKPTLTPTLKPTLSPTIKVTLAPTIKPTLTPTLKPTLSPTIKVTLAPTIKPTLTPTLKPTLSPTVKVTVAPTVKVTVTPTLKPTVSTIRPTLKPTLTPTVVPSDIELKHDVVRLGNVAGGIGLYRFQYNWSDQVYVGVIAQEVAAVRPDAVRRGDDGYLRVDYARLGLRFQTWDEWLAAGGQPNSP